MRKVRDLFKDYLIRKVLGVLICLRNQDAKKYFNIYFSLCSQLKEVPVLKSDMIFWGLNFRRKKNQFLAEYHQMVKSEERFYLVVKPITETDILMNAYIPDGYCEGCGEDKIVMSILVFLHSALGTIEITHTDDKLFFEIWRRCESYYPSAEEKDYIIGRRYFTADMDFFFAASSSIQSRYLLRGQFVYSKSWKTLLKYKPISYLDYGKKFVGDAFEENDFLFTQFILEKINEKGNIGYSEKKIVVHSNGPFENSIPMIYVKDSEKCKTELKQYSYKELLQMSIEVDTNRYYNDDELSVLIILYIISPEIIEQIKKKDAVISFIRILSSVH